MGGSEDTAAAAPLPPQPPGSAARKTYWRSASWSAPRAGSQPAEDSSSSNDMPWKYPVTPLTPRSLSAKARLCLPPLQPLAIAPRSLDEWPKPGSDDIGEWTHPPTPGSRPCSSAGKLGDGLKFDLPPFRPQAQKDQMAFFDKECSKVADHIYLGGDSVARNRDILHQNGITHVLNCVGFVCPEYFKADFVYRTLWLQDSPTEDITSILYDVFDYFEDVREHGGRVFVHCCQGVSRSTSLVIAYLMWREGQSFDDAFQFVKAARAIANPNMGFACQLLQCQKRVHAIPLSPNSLLRMFRIAPHSPYDPLHLVPKILSEPSPSALDSRGAFIIHVVSSIYVWIGSNCELMMKNDAKAAASQVVRYEKVQGELFMVEEGYEPKEFWEAFSSSSCAPDTNKVISKPQFDLATKIAAGKRRVESYNGEFELFYKATAGGVVPPFSSPLCGHETHLPARESSWSELRRKRMSGTVIRCFTNSLLKRGGESNYMSVQHPSIDTSPTFLSPCSFSSDSTVTVSPNCSYGSPAVSPSNCSSPLLTLSPTFPKSPLQHSRVNDQVKPLNQVACSPSKSPASSIAERRGAFSSLRLPSVQRDPIVIPSIQPLMSEEQHKQCIDPISIDNNTAMDIEIIDNSSTPDVNQSSEVALGTSSDAQPLVYQWPTMARLTSSLSLEDLDSRAVYIFVTFDKIGCGEAGRMIYIWVGSQFVLNNTRDCSERSKVAVIDDWYQVGFDFLDSMGFPKNLPIKVVNECDAENFFKLLNPSR